MKYEKKNFILKINVTGITKDLLKCTSKKGVHFFCYENRRTN